MLTDDIKISVWEMVEAKVIYKVTWTLSYPWSVGCPCVKGSFILQQNVLPRNEYMWDLALIV